MPCIIDGMWVDVIQEPLVAGGWLQVRAGPESARLKRRGKGTETQQEMAR